MLKVMITSELLDPQNLKKKKLPFRRYFLQKTQNYELRQPSATDRPSITMTDIVLAMVTDVSAHTCPQQSAILTTHRHRHAHTDTDTDRHTHTDTDTDRHTHTQAADQIPQTFPFMVLPNLP